MHPRNSTLMAFRDAESGAGQSQRIARHLSNCAKCRDRLASIERERAELSIEYSASARGLAAGDLPAFPDNQGASSTPSDLAAVQSAIAAWREGRNGAAAAALRARLRGQMETYFGAPALSLVERPAIPAEEMLGKTSELLEAFLGPEAAEAARDEIFRGRDWAEPAGEALR